MAKRSKALSPTEVAINHHVQSKLSVLWDMCSEPSGYDFPKGLSVSHDPPFPPRLVQNGWKVGTASWCCVCCDLVDKKEIKIEFLNEKVHLMIFKVTQFVELRKYIPALKPYYVQVVGTTSKWACWNWSPIGIDTPDEAAKYLTGWTP